MIFRRMNKRVRRFSVLVLFKFVTRCRFHVQLSENRWEELDENERGEGKKVRRKRVGSCC